jgi:IS1 family transposase
MVSFMNKLPLTKRVLILQILCEGGSLRSASRIADCSLNTVMKLLVDIGDVCRTYHDEHVRNVKARRVQCDEIWAFNYAKQKNVATAKAAPIGAGDIWTWTALDADSKLCISWLCGSRDGEYARALMDDLRSRLSNRVQITSDGHRAYLEAVEGAFGSDVDYAMLVKLYGEAPEAQKRYSPAVCIGARKTTITGTPDPDYVSTSYVERANLTMRMAMRRFTRLTNAFSKKLANHEASIALYAIHYNFARIHKTLRVTPAMEAGLSNHLWSYEEIAGLLDKDAAPPAKRGPYKKQPAEISN